MEDKTIIQEPVRLSNDRVHPFSGLIIHAPEWYEREDFLEWLNKRDEHAIATWHRPGKPANFFSDVFVTFDGGEGSDAEQMPEDIWDEIGRQCRARGLENCLVWVQNNLS